MRGSVKHIAGTFLVLIIMIQVINLSVDSLGFYTETSAVANFDDQDYTDSMLEFIVENVLGYSKHTIHDKANSNSTSKMQQYAFHWDVKLFYTSMNLAVNTAENFSSNFFLMNDRLVNLCNSEVLPKPPQSLLA